MLINTATYRATIHCGLQEDLWLRHNGKAEARIHTIDEVIEWCQLCIGDRNIRVNITKTKSLSNIGIKPGVTIEFIPQKRMWLLSRKKIREFMVELAEVLQCAFTQKCVTVICSDNITLVERGHD